MRGRGGWVDCRMYFLELAWCWCGLWFREYWGVGANDGFVG